MKTVCTRLQSENAALAAEIAVANAEWKKVYDAHLRAEAKAAALKSEHDFMQNEHAEDHAEVKRLRTLLKRIHDCEQRWGPDGWQGALNQMFEAAGRGEGGKKGEEA